MEENSIYLIAAFLIAHECGMWRHPYSGELRIYLNRYAHDLLDMEVEYYNTGNLQFFSWHGEKHSNTYGKKVLARLDKAYFSLNDGKFHCNAFFRHDDISDEILKGLREATEERIKTENAATDPAVQKILQKLEQNQQ